MKKVFLYLCLLVAAHQSSAQSCSCSGCTGGVGSMNLSNENGVSLAKGSWMAELNGQYIRFEMPGMVSSDAFHLTGTTELKDAFSLTPILRYGLSDRLTISAALPYVTIQAAANGWTSTGFSDLMLLGDYHAFGDGVDKIKVSLLAGIKPPTGNQQPYEQDLPIALSSGSYDPIVGATLQKKYGRFNIRANALYKHSNKGFQDVYFGDFFIHSLLASFQPGENKNRAEGDSLKKEPSTQFAIYGGLAGEDIGAQVQYDLTLPNSGSYYLYAKAGIIFTFSRNISLPVAFELPIYKSISGIQNEASYRINTGLQLKF